MFASFIYRKYFSNEYELNKRYFKHYVVNYRQGY